MLPGAATGQGLVPAGPGIVPGQDRYGAVFASRGWFLSSMSVARKAMTVAVSERHGYTG